MCVIHWPITVGVDQRCVFQRVWVLGIVCTLQFETVEEDYDYSVRNPE